MVVKEIIFIGNKFYYYIIIWCRSSFGLSWCVFNTSFLELLDFVLLNRIWKKCYHSLTMLRKLACWYGFDSMCLCTFVSLPNFLHLKIAWVLGRVLFDERNNVKWAGVVKIFQFFENIYKSFSTNFFVNHLHRAV